MNPKKLGKTARPPFLKGEPWHKDSLKFTPLNTRVSEVFMEIRRDPTFRWPIKIKGYSRRRDPTRFYEYHGENGHFTKDCINLHHEIECFITNRKLVWFLVDERNQGRNPQGPLLMEGN
jgi:hypothetical protein